VLKNANNKKKSRSFIATPIKAPIYIEYFAKDKENVRVGKRELGLRTH